jgi:integrase
MEGKMQVDDSIIEKWLVTLKSHSKLSQTNYHHQILKYIDVYNGTLTPQTLESFLIEGTGGDKGKRISARKSIMKNFVKWVCREHLQEWLEYEEIFERVKYKKYARLHPETLTDDEFFILVEGLKNPMLKVIFMVIYDTGARIRAILTVKRNDIQMSGDKYFVKLTEKGKKTPLKRLTQETWNELNVLMESNEYLYPFLESDSAAISIINDRYYQLWSELKNEGKRLINQPVSFHWGRRASGMHIYDKTGNDIVAVQGFLGHESPVTTALYLKTAERKLDRLLDNETRPWGKKK